MRWEGPQKYPGPLQTEAGPAHVMRAAESGQDGLWGYSPLGTSERELRRAMAIKLGHQGKIQPQCTPPAATSVLAMGSSPRWLQGLPQIT